MTIIDLFPLTSDADAAVVVPFHNMALRELFPRRSAMSVDAFRARFSRPQEESLYFGIKDGHNALAALGTTVRWVDGTNEHLVFFQCLVRPDMRRMGLGRTLLGRALAIAEEHGRSVILADVVDTVPAGEMFANAVNADLGLREHINVVAVDDLDIGMLERWQAEGPGRAPGYELLEWENTYPDEHHAEIARLFVIADEDMPFEDASFDPQAETAESVKERLDRTAGVVERVASVVQHIASGDLAGFSELVMLAPGDPTIHTSLTVVDREHRGHAIGKWVKANAILRGIERFPDVTHIQTENVFSNAPMLGINDAIGFVPEHTLVSYQASTDTVRTYLELR